MKRLVSYLLCASLLVPLINIFAAPPSSAKAQAGESARKADIQSGIQRLKSNTGGAALVSTSTATGAARFVRMPSGAQAGLSSGTGSAQDKSAAFFRDYGSAFGVTSPANELKLGSDVADKIGSRHLTYRQVYMNVPVFAGVLKTHFDVAGVLRAVNGNFIPDINLNPAPSRKAGEAAAVAVEHVKANPGDGESGAKSNAPLAAVNSTLYVFRANLAQGIPGQNHLVWEVEVTNRADVRDRVYVDAHTLKIVDMISGNHETLDRRAYDGGNLPTVPPGYPATPFWVETDPFPTGNTEADNMIVASKETYDLYNNGFSRDSIDGAGALMDSIFNRGYGCPNASWNGTFISFCPGFTTDDVTSHEWSHAYTQYTHNLIYQWQPGALNESYSDIFGETVDRINGRDDVGNSGTDSARVVGNCSDFGPTVAQYIVNSPPSIAGTFPAQAAQFGAALDGTGVTGNVVLAVDDNTDPIGGTDVNDGCGAITNGAALSGNIALIRRGTCNFSAKVYNAQQAGAVAVVIFNNVASGLPGMGAGVNAGLVTIPSIGVTQAEGDSLLSQIAAPPNVTMRSSAGATDNSTKWLLGEDVSPGGALRDMYNPICYSNPGKVSDTAYYVCSTADGGGVHTNSGVPNHAYALLVDGGTYNGQTISAIGLTKAAHIYFRAESVYQHSASDFLDHADSIEQSATDLIGQNLASLINGTPSGEIITAADVTEVQQAALAVELRTPPTFCGFQPLLAQSPPAFTCGAGTNYVFIFSDDFEGDNSDWTVSNTPVNPATHDVADWVVSSTPPENHGGKAFFAENTAALGDCAADDESGVQHLESPTINVPVAATTPTLRFDHWIATESTFDGGQLSVSVDGGAYTLVPQAAYIYNAPNLVLATAGAGNTNPRQAQRAWSGTDGGSVDGSWGTTVVDLSQVGVTGGHTVKLRYDLSQDGCGGNFGWYIDNLQILTCLAPTATPAQISGRITTPDGAPLGGVSMRLSGARTARVITDVGGNYRFENVDGNNFYTVTPTLVSYHFSPESQSFMLAANNVDAVFTATRDAVSSGNAIDTADFFVRQHYLDFLGREPDAGGFNFWSDQILSCGGDSNCRERRTINVSAAYFLSVEFTQTGGLVDGLYRASYGRRPFYNEFMPDTAVVARDVVVGRAGWAQTLEANKQAFVTAWMERADFRTAYDGLGNDAYVDSLISHSAGFNGDRSALLNGLNGGSLSRAAVLSQVVENEGFVNAKHNEMFVMMEYFGYLRRDPDASGYQFWLNKLNQFGGNFEQAEMVKAFIVSGEYRDRFRQQ